MAIHMHVHEYLMAVRADNLLMTMPEHLTTLRQISMFLTPTYYIHNESVASNDDL
jgi:hypothetical protein